MKEKLKYFTKENYVFILILPIIISIILFFYEKIFATIGLIFVALLYFYIKKIDRQNEDFFQAYIDEMDYSFDEITKNVVFQMPFPIVILEDGKTIKWHNSNFKELFEAKNLIGKSVKNFITDFNEVDFSKESTEPITVNI